MSLVPRINDNPECNRAIYQPVEWECIKEAIDNIRTLDVEDAAYQLARSTLMGYNLWDYNTDKQDEKQINLLYMRYT